MKLNKFHCKSKTQSSCNHSLPHPKQRLCKSLLPNPTLHYINGKSRFIKSRFILKLDTTHPNLSTQKLTISSPLDLWNNSTQYGVFLFIIIFEILKHWIHNHYSFPSPTHTPYKNILLISKISSSFASIRW